MKKTIAVICGGDSSEHDVSLRSGAGIYSFFDKEKYNVYIVDLKTGDWHVNLPDCSAAEIDKNDFSFTENGEKKNFDFAYITIHGAPGENGVLQGYFELIGLPYSTSGVLVEAMTFDKFVLNNYLRGFGVTVAESVLVRKGDEASITDERIKATVGYPCFVKPAADGSSFGVSKVKSFDDMAKALELAFGESDTVMIEAFLQGMEISQGVYKVKKADGTKKAVVLPATEVVTQNEFFDYDAKYNGQVEEITPARMDDETADRVAKITSAIYDILDCRGIVRIDYIINKEAEGGAKISMLEINTTPGMTATSFIPQQVRAAGLNMGEVLSEIVEEAFA